MSDRPQSERTPLVSTWSGRTLEERAREYARLPEEEDDGYEDDVLLFRLGAERYAIELRSLLAIQPAGGLAPVPCTPAHVAGVVNVRGEIITVLNLVNILELPELSASSGSARVLLVAHGQDKVGLLVDEVLGVRPLSVRKLERALSGKEFARGVAEGSIVYLDLESLLSEGRLEVFEEVT